MQFDFTLAANGGQQIEVAGKFFKYKSGTGAIRVKTNKGGFVDLLPGQGVWNVEYTSLVIVDKSGSANTGTLIAGNFDFRDDRIVGTVDVVDGGKARTLTDSAFIGAGGCALVAATYSHWQINNPTGSGKRVIIKSVSITSPTAGPIGMGFTPTLATLIGNFKSKRNLGTNSVATQRYENNASILVTTNVVFVNIQASTTLQIVFQEPIVLEPSFGLTMVHQAIASTLNGTYEFIEELM